MECGPSNAPRHGRRRLRLVPLAIVLAVLPLCSCRVRRQEEVHPSTTGSVAPVVAVPEAGAPGEAAASSPAPGATTGAPARDGGASDAGAPAAPPPRGSAALALGGVGSAPGETGSVERAVRRALVALGARETALDAAVRGVEVLEDDPALNAGTGAARRVNGAIELDAAVMDGEGRFGGVAGVTDVRHPVRVARAVVETPHRVLTGAGATAFARWLGILPHDPGTAASRAEYERALARLGQSSDGGADVTAWTSDRRGPAAAFLAYVDPPIRPPPTARRDAGAETAAAPTGSAAQPAPVPPVPALSAAVPVASVAVPVASVAVPVASVASPVASAAVPVASVAVPVASVASPVASAASPGAPARPARASDTVAVLVRSGTGEFAAAASTGGPVLALPGRLSDVCVPGAALFAGKEGAVAITGPGEELLDLGLARRTYERLLLTRSPKTAAAWATKQVAAGERIAVLVVDAHSSGVAATAPLAWAMTDSTERTSAGEATP